MQLNKKDWKTVSFGDVVFQGKGTVDPETSGLERYIAGEHMATEDLHIRQWGTVGNGYLGPAFHRPFEKGDILYGSRRTYLKKVAVADFEGITSNTTFVIKENQELVVPGFIPFLMLSDRFTEHSVKNSKGSVNPYINFKDITKFKFRLPPRDQQARLAELLWAEDEMGEKYQDLIETQKLVLKSYTTPAFSESESMVTLKECGKFFTGSTPLRAEYELYFKDGSIPWVKTLDLNNGEIFDTEEKITPFALKKTSCKLMPEGTVLVAMYGGFNQIGRTGILRISAATNQAVCSFVPDENVLLPDFLLYQLNDRRDYWKTVAVSSRKDPNITKQDVEQFPVILLDLDRQREIISQIQTLSLSIQNTKNIFEQASRVKQELINQIFSA